jgi:hypothetical protein
MRDHLQRLLDAGQSQQSGRFDRALGHHRRSVGARRLGEVGVLGGRVNPDREHVAQPGRDPAEGMGSPWNSWATTVAPLGASALVPSRSRAATWRPMPLKLNRRESLPPPMLRSHRAVGRRWPR